MTMKTIFKAELITLHGNRYPVKTTNQELLGYYSSLKMAEKAIAKDVKDSTPDIIACDFCYIVWEWVLDAIRKTGRYADRYYEPISIRTYTPDGKFYEQNLVDRDGFFRGRPKDKQRFKEGDIVEVFDFDEAILGIVVGAPPTPEVVESIRQSAIKDGHLKKDEWYWMDSGDDQYTVLPASWKGAHTHVEAQFVFPPTKPVSEKFRQMLIEVTKIDYE